MRSTRFSPRSTGSSTASSATGPAAPAAGCRRWTWSRPTATSSCGPTPGLTRDDVEIEIKDGVLTVSGERKAEHEEKEEGFYRVERAFGNFSRSLSLPQGIDAGAVGANFDNGVLEVRVPKPAERKPTRVQIGSGTVESTAEEK